MIVIDCTYKYIYEQMLPRAATQTSRHIVNITASAVRVFDQKIILYCYNRPHR